MEPGTKYWLKSYFVLYFENTWKYPPKNIFWNMVASSNTRIWPSCCLVYTRFTEIHGNKIYLRDIEWFFLNPNKLFEESKKKWFLAFFVLKTFTYRCENEMLSDAQRWGVTVCYGRPIFIFFIKENWICVMARHHTEPKTNTLLTRNLPFDSDVRQWSHPLMIPLVEQPRVGAAFFFKGKHISLPRNKCSYVQPWKKYLRNTIVFMWNSALREIFFFSSLLLVSAEMFVFGGRLSTSL